MIQVFIKINNAVLMGILLLRSPMRPLCVLLVDFALNTLFSFTNPVFFRYTTMVWSLIDVF